MWGGLTGIGDAGHDDQGGGDSQHGEHDRLRRVLCGKGGGEEDRENKHFAQVGKIAQGGKNEAMRRPPRVAFASRPS